LWISDVIIFFGGTQIEITDVTYKESFYNFFSFRNSKANNFFFKSKGWLLFLELCNGMLKAHIFAFLLLATTQRI